MTNEAPILSENNKAQINSTHTDSVAIVSETDTIVKENIVANPVKVTMTAGKTLRIIALEQLGNREFWVYIYLKNKQSIKNPNIVPIGTELILPDPNEFDMNASDTGSVAKAKELGNSVLASLS